MPANYRSPVVCWTACVALLLSACSDEAPGTPAPDGGVTPVDSGTVAPRPDSGPNPTADLVSLRIEPSMLNLVIDARTPATRVLTVWGSTAAGTERDVTGLAAFSVADDSLGEFSGRNFTTALKGGDSTIDARLGTLAASMDLRIEVLDITFEGNVPTDAETIFTGATDTPGRAPQIVYPNEGVLLPPNLGSIEIHYLPGPAMNTLFEVTLQSPRAQAKIYTRCTPLGVGCLLTIRGALYSMLADTNGGRAPVDVTITGTDDAGTASGRSTVLQMGFAPAAVIGAIYYWTTTDSGIMRVEFGSEQPPERFFPFEGNTCYGCHALSRNGKRMALSVGGNGRADLALVDVGAQTVTLEPSTANQEQFQSWNPTSDKFVGVWADTDPVDTNLRIRDGVTGALVETIPLGVEPTHPDWSASGTHIVFTEVTSHQATFRPGRGGISYVQTQAGGGWSAPTRLLEATDGRNRYYPTYSPDGQVVVFNESQCPAGQIYTPACDGDSDPSAMLWALPAAGGAPTQLARANAPGLQDQGRADLTNSYPKWAPFVDSRDADGAGRLMWMTFSSRRNYGLRTPDGSNSLIWMTAVDPDAVLAGRDGSAPAFALHFQDLATSNHIAQWAAQIAPDPTEPTDCLSAGDPCDPTNDLCCAGTQCVEQGPDIYLCRPQF
jgi:hypothetical protein